MSGIYMRRVTPEHQTMREKVALEHGFSLYKLYSEKQASAFWGKDISTMKRNRGDGLFDDKFPYRHGEDGIRYLGIYIADLIIWGTGPWPNEPESIPSEPSNLEPTGSGNEKALPPGIVAGVKVDAQSALRLAQQSLRKQSRG